MNVPTVSESDFDCTWAHCCDSLVMIPVRMHLAVHFKTFQNQGYFTYVA